MTNFLFDLASNLALLAMVLVACHLCNRLIPGAALNGSRVFAALVFVAVLLDAALTFLVFADARTRYGQFSTSTAFFTRSAAYALAVVAAFVWSSRSRRNVLAKAGADKALVIPTSPYTESHLPM
ncbi:fucose 4-O-acetylase-like acetyltransferase [Burkholderia sp. OAS925]|uniref:hypothetical protein n=1 Tax=Paraburkholderia TaxID=1822464 RepID=UPI00178B5849|nr:hypothetical protein [Paraburkholderia graminis]MDR6474969.1 fucose 4-O-acetylase-like acetyltransferase [Paraburkholderia graminis]